MSIRHCTAPTAPRSDSKSIDTQDPVVLPLAYGIQGGFRSDDGSFTMRAIACFLSVLWFIHLPAAQELQHEVTVTLKLIQVYVTDPQGNPVTDLQASDFVLYDNGRPQSITDFESHLLPQKTTQVEETLTETPVPVSKVGSLRTNRKFFLIVDLFRNDLPGMRQAKKAALHFIETQLLPADEIALLTYSQNHGLVMHEFLTQNHAKIAARVGKARGLTSMTLNDFAAELEMPVPEIEDPSVEFIKMKIRQFAQDMKELAMALRSIAGFKHIILFSSGISREFLYDKLYNTPEGMAKIDPGIRVLFDDMTKELASSSSPVYTINTLGTRAHFQEHGQRGDHSLQMVSEVSGGMYFRDVTSYKEISESIQNATGSYYVLGYTIDERTDGKFHDIKVEVNRTGCVVHAQAGYFNPKPFSEFSHVEKQLHLLELALSDRTRLENTPGFSMIALPCSDAPRSNLMILAEIPPRRSVDAASGRAEIVTMIFDQRNSIVASLKGEINYSTLPQKRFLLYALSSLEPGAYQCRVVIRNLKSGSGAVAASSVKIQPAIARGVRVFPPMLLVPEANAGYLRISEEGRRDQSDSASSLNRIYPFQAERLAPLMGELPRETRSLRAVVRTIVAGTWGSDVELSLFLIEQASGKRRSLDFSLLDVTHTTGTAYLLEIDLPELEPMEYILETVAHESVTGTESRASRSLGIR